jgi:hypothetical protein
MAESQAELARTQGLECFYVTRRGFRDNLIQYIPTDPASRLGILAEAHRRFVRTRRLPNGGRGILEHCVVTPGFPIDFD